MSKQRKNTNYIHMRCWTEADHSSAESAAKSITAAVRFIRLHSQFHANWSMEFVSEPPNIIAARSGGSREGKDE